MLLGCWTAYYMHVCIRDTFIQYIENMTYQEFVDNYLK